MTTGISVPGRGGESCGGDVALSAPANESVADHEPFSFWSATMFHRLDRFIHPSDVRLPDIIALNSATRSGKVRPMGIIHGSCAASYTRLAISTCPTMFLTSR